MNNYGYVSSDVPQGHVGMYQSGHNRKTWFRNPDKDISVIEYFCHPQMSFCIANDRLALIMEHA